MKKKFQIAALCVVLLAVIGGGIWFLTGSSRTGGPDTAEDPHEAENIPGPSGGVEAGAFDLSSLEPRYYSLQTREEDVPLLLGGTVDAATIYSYEGQFCLLTPRWGETEGEFWVDVVSMDTGETLHSFSGEDFPQSYDFPDSYGHVELGACFYGLTLDDSGTLWAYYLFWGDEYEWEALIAPCTPEATEEDIVRLVNPGAVQWSFTDKFLVRDGRAFLICISKFIVVDLSDGSCVLPAGEETVVDFCLDADGNVFYLRGNSRNLEKYSPKDGTRIWTKSTTVEFSVYPQRVSYTAPNGLFVSGTNSTAGRDGIYWIDPETGGTCVELLSFDLDIEDPPEYSTYLQFVVDDQYWVYASDYYYDFSSDDPADYRSERYIYLMEPEERTVSDAKPVTLTITAPYQVESIANAVRVYQRTHPEVEVAWDTQYVSREDFQKNSLEYKDQITMRAMTGDVGDLVMITGSGMSQDVATDTDVFIDLSGYLEDCPFREELRWNVIETLRGDDGAIRAMPLAMRPDYYLWNPTLLEELGNPVDPDNVTWMELLDLALEWKEEGQPYSILAASERDYLEDDILYDILLANLYSAEQPDGTVQLDQPYLRELLEKFVQLRGSSQLVGAITDDEAIVQENALMSNIGSIDWDSTIYSLMRAEQATGGEIRAAVRPKGEVNKKQQGYGFCWGIPTSSGNQEAAWEFLQYLVSADGLPGGAYTYDTVPVNTVAQEGLSASLERWEEDLNAIAKKYFYQFCDLQEVPYARLDEPYGWYNAVYAPIKAYIDGETTLDEALETANDNWERFVLE